MFQRIEDGLFVCVLFRLETDEGTFTEEAAVGEWLLGGAVLTTADLECLNTSGLISLVTYSPWGNPPTVLVAHVDSSNALTFATINGAIIAIAVAALVGYALIVFQSLDSMVKELVDRANELLQDKHIGGIQWESKGSDERDLMTSDTLSTDEWLEAVRKLSTGGEVVIGGKVTVAKDDPATRGRWLVQASQKVLFHYPFAGKQLHNPDDVRGWLPDVSKAIRGLNMALNRDLPIDANPETLAAAADFDQDHLLNGVLAKAGLNPTMRSHLEKQQGRYGQRLAKVREVLAEHQRLLRELYRNLGRIDRYQKRVVPSRRTIAIVGAAMLIAFGCGVAAPMLDQGTPAFFTVWVPIVIYSAGFVTALVWALKKAQR